MQGVTKHRDYFFVDEGDKGEEGWIDSLQIEIGEQKEMLILLGIIIVLFGEERGLMRCLNFCGFYTNSTL